MKNYYHIFKFFISCYVQAFDRIYALQYHPCVNRGFIKTVNILKSANKFLILFVITFITTSCSEEKYRADYDANIVQSAHFDETMEDLGDLNHDIPDMVYDCQRASFNLKGVGLQHLVRLLSNVYDENINTTLTDPEKDVKLNLKIDEICLEPLLNELTSLYNIGFEKTFSAYTIYPPEIRAKIFTVDYHNFMRSGESSISISSSQLDGKNSKNSNFSKIDTKSEESFWANLERTLNTMVLDGFDPDEKIKKDKSGSTSYVAVYRDSGIIVVRSYPRILKNVEAFLNSITYKATKQVLIEAKILEVTLNDEFRSGIYWQLLKQKFRFNSFDDVSGLSGSEIFAKDRLSVMDSSITSSVISAKLNARPDFESVIQALSVQGKVSVLSSPKIAALNNQRALIKFGDDSYFITSVSNVTTSTGTNSQTSQGFDLTPYFSGIALDTTPSIMSNNEIILHIHPIISTVVPENKEVNIAGQTSTVPAAKIKTRETDTVVKAQSGDIIVIGGLMQSSVDMNESGIPEPKSGFITKLLQPFKAQHKKTKKIELVILMRPVISPGWVNKTENFDKYLFREK